MLSRVVLCLDCPLACPLEVTLGEGGAILECRGAQCKRGLPYARQELSAPMRVLTTTLLTEGSGEPLLPVRTDQPIPKGNLQEGMALLACVKVTPPVVMGQVLVEDLMGTGANLIASDELRE